MEEKTIVKFRCKEDYDYDAIVRLSSNELKFLRWLMSQPYELINDDYWDVEIGYDPTQTFIEFSGKE